MLTRIRVWLRDIKIKINRRKDFVVIYRHKSKQFEVRFSLFYWVKKLGVSLSYPLHTYTSSWYRKSRFTMDQISPTPNTQPSNRLINWLLDLTRSALFLFFLYPNAGHGTCETAPNTSATLITRANQHTRIITRRDFARTWLDRADRSMQIG